MQVDFDDAYLSVVETLVATGLSMDEASGVTEGIRQSYPELSAMVGADRQINGVGAHTMCADLSTMIRILYHRPDSAPVGKLVHTWATELCTQLRAPLSTLILLKQLHARCTRDTDTSNRCGPPDAGVPRQVEISAAVGDAGVVGIDSAMDVTIMSTESEDDSEDESEDGDDDEDEDEDGDMTIRPPKRLRVYPPREILIQGRVPFFGKPKTIPDTSWVYGKTTLRPQQTENTARKDPQLMREHEFGRLDAALDARDGDHVLIQETTRQGTDGCTYRLLEPEQWSKLEKNKYEGVLSLVTTSRTCPLALPFFRLVVDATHNEAKKEMWDTVLHLVVAGAVVFGSHEVTAVCCNMLFAGVLTCDVVLRGAGVTVLSTADMHKMLNCAVLTLTEVCPLQHVRPASDIYDVGGCFLSVGSSRPDGCGRKIPTNTFGLTVGGDGKYAFMLSSGVTCDYEVERSADPMWGTVAERQWSDRVGVGLGALSTGTLRRLIPVDASDSEDEGETGALGEGKSEGIVLPDKRSRPEIDRGPVTVVGFHVQEQDFIAMGGYMGTEVVRLAGLAARPASALGVTGDKWAMMVSPNGRPVFTQWTSSLPGRLGHCLVKGERHTNGPYSPVCVDLMTGVMGAQCSVEGGCAQRRGVVLRPSALAISRLATMIHDRDEYIMRFPDHLGGVTLATGPVEPIDPVDLSARRRKTTTWMSGRVMGAVRKVDSDRVVCVPDDAPRRFYVSELTGSSVDQAERAKTRMYLRAVLNTLLVGEACWVTMREEYDHDDDDWSGCINEDTDRAVIVNGGDLAAQMLACYEVLLGTGPQGGNVIVVDISIRSVLGEMAEWADKMGVLRVAELPGTMSLEYSAGVPLIRGDKIALVLECQLTAYSALKAHMNHVTVDVAMCPAVVPQCFSEMVSKGTDVTQLVIVCASGALPGVPCKIAGSIAAVTKVDIPSKESPGSMTEFLREAADKRKKGQTGGSHVVVWDPAALDSGNLVALIGALGDLSSDLSGRISCSLLYPGHPGPCGSLASLILLHHPYRLKEYVAPPLFLPEPVDHSFYGEGFGGPRPGEREEREYMELQISAFNLLFARDAQLRINASMTHFLSDPGGHLREMFHQGVIVLKRYTLPQKVDPRHPLWHKVVPPGHAAPHQVLPVDATCLRYTLGGERNNVIGSVKKKKGCTVQLFVTNPRTAAYMLCTSLWDIFVGCPGEYIRVMVVVPSDCEMTPMTNMTGPLGYRAVENTMFS